MLHNKELERQLSKLSKEHAIYCVLLIGKSLLLTDRLRSVTLYIDRLPLPENVRYAKFAPLSGERYLQTKIRAKVRSHLDYLLKIAKLNVKSSGVLDPTV